MATHSNALSRNSSGSKKTSLGARDPVTARRIKLAMLLMLVLLLLVALPRKARAQSVAGSNQVSEQSADWATATGQLANNIFAITGPSAVSVAVENRSSLSTQEASEVADLIAARLRSAGARLSTPAGAAYRASITISEDVHGFVLASATTTSSGAPSVQIVQAPRLAAPAEAVSQVSLRKHLLLTANQRILDAQFLNGQAYVNGVPQRTLVVLEPQRVTVYVKQGEGQWQRTGSADLVSHHPLPRDTRGRLWTRADGFDAYLPGMVCSSSSLAPLAVACRESDDPWPVDGFYNAARNYFTRGLDDFSDVATKFYSAAIFFVSRTDQGHILFTTASGVYRSEGNQPVPLSALNWGSDIALLFTTKTGVPEQNACASFHVLATSNLDYSAPDSLRAYELEGQGLENAMGRRVFAASDALEFPGPITALWSDINQTAVIAITHNLETGSYEAYSITASCLQ
jgi:hypothetical protein